MKETVRSTFAALALGATLMVGGCEPAPKPYGNEHQLFLPGVKRQVWAVAPVVNISGQKTVDPILQADLVYQQMQQVHGLTVLPVNRVAEVMTGLKIEKVQSAEQAALICDLLGCDALVLATVTVFDPYDPPKLGASLQVFSKPTGFMRPKNIDVRELSRAAAPTEDQSLPAANASFLQAVGIYDAANGSVRDAVLQYAAGRHDPEGPMGSKEYTASMDRYCGFVYHELTTELLKQMDPTKEGNKDNKASVATYQVPARGKKSHGN